LLAASGCVVPPSPYPDEWGYAPARPGAVTLKGEPIALIGPELPLGFRAPDFVALDADFAPVRLSDFRGKTVLISAVPSLDTGVCAQETRRFNQELAGMPTNVMGITISMDLPFAQKRFCEAEKIGGLIVLSDSAWRSFGVRYGVLMAGRGLLARAVFVVGPDGRLRYREIVPEITTEPDYTRVLDAVRRTAGLK
jgi:thioredoxin-dependent peroxiredoxin